MPSISASFGNCLVNLRISFFSDRQSLIVSFLRIIQRSKNDDIGMAKKTYLFYELKNQKRSQKLGQISVLFRWFCVKLRGKTKPQQKTGWQTQGGIRRPMDVRQKDRQTDNPIFGDVWKTRMGFFFLNEINVDCFSYFVFLVFKELDWKFLNSKKNKLNIQKKSLKICTW